MSEHTGCAYEYTVRRGDSFYLIAQKTGITLRELIAANPQIPPSRLTVGDVLCIPYSDCLNQPAQDPADTPITDNNAVCPNNRRAVVQQGQTAADLQLQYNLSYYTLQTANSGVNLDTIGSGDVLCVPEQNTACPIQRTVILGELDTLQSAALSNRVSVADLLKANPCIAPEDFVPGTVIKLPDLPQS